MQRWQFSLLSFFLLLGLGASSLILKPEKPKPAVLADIITADVTNYVTVISPTPTPIISSTPTPTPTPTTGPSSTPTAGFTPTPTAIPMNLVLTLDVSPPANGLFYVANEVITVYISYRSLVPGTQTLTLLLNYPLGRIDNSPINLIDALVYVNGSAIKSPEGTIPTINLNNRTIAWKITSLTGSGTKSKVSLKLKVLNNSSNKQVFNDLILSSIFGGITQPNKQITLKLYNLITPTPTLISQASPSPGLPPIPTPIEEPEQYFTYSLFGYTSSYANVRLEGIKLLEGTKANEKGYFEFINFKASNRNLEFCLLSIDTENLVSPPLCVPVPQALTGRAYGPYLLPPTLKLAKGDIQTGEQSEVSGKTIPGASVNIHVFDQPEKPLARIIKSVLAADRPEIMKLNSTTDGSFSTKLIGANPGKKRVFAQSIFNIEQADNKTPKSVTLTLNILNLFLALLFQFFSLFKSLFSLNLILFLQFLLIIYLILRRKKIFNWYYLYHHKKTAIVLYRKGNIIKAVKNYCPL